MTMKKMIWVTFQRAGFHNFPRAGYDQILNDVAYLSNKHRHLFKFKVSVEVFHDDREIEFHQLLNWLESRFDGAINIDNKSCEMLADDLFLTISSKYPDRDITIEISEDGECGVTVEYKK